MFMITLPLCSAYKTEIHSHLPEMMANYGETETVPGSSEDI